MTFDHTIDEATIRRVVDLSEAVQRAISRCEWWAMA